MPLAIAPPIFRAENERDSMPDQAVGHTLNIEMAPAVSVPEFATKTATKQKRT
jgi:hypothetical protein